MDSASYAKPTIKLLKLFATKNVGILSGISSYALKTVVMHTIRLASSRPKALVMRKLVGAAGPTVVDLNARGQSPEDRFLEALNHLMVCLERSWLPAYFNEEENLFEGMVPTEALEKTVWLKFQITKLRRSMLFRPRRLESWKSYFI